MTAQQKLKKKFDDGFHICVGLDTDINKIPKHLLNRNNPVVEFNKIVIENTYKEAAAYKINFAFYESDGAKGFDNISETLGFIPSGLVTIADAKRGDIGNTSQMYAHAVFSHFNFDAITLHPYMGYDSIFPFLEYKDKINFVLALTSNPGSSDFEKQIMADGNFLFQKVINKVSEWNINQNCGIVFGATNLKELNENIGLFGELIVLLPGVGAQGGSLKDIAKVFLDHKKKNYLINVSRALIYSDSTARFGDTISQIIKDYNSNISSML